MNGCVDVEKVILLIEDDREISQLVTSHLTQESFTVLTAFDGAAAAQLLENSRVDLILLDLMLPKLSGLELLKRIRAASTTPVLIISAKDSDIDKALGLELGADDYISKPFSMIELVARINAAIRRATQTFSGARQPNASTVLEYKDLKLDLTTFTAQVGNISVPLTSKEFNILKLFMTNQRRVFTKEQIFHFIWQEDFIGNENVINVHIRRLREKIEHDPSKPVYIRTIWGIGYKLGE